MTHTKQECRASSHPTRWVGWRRKINSATAPVTTTTAPIIALDQLWLATNTAHRPIIGSGTARGHVLFMAPVWRRVTRTSASPGHFPVRPGTLPSCGRAADWARLAVSATVADTNQKEPAMPLSTFEKFLPWSGVIAGVAWIGQDALAHMYSTDQPGRGSVAVVNDHTALNLGSLSCLVLMGVALLFFATAVRNLLRSGEASEATYSSVAYGAWITVSAALGQMALWDKALLSAADDKNVSATQTLSYAQYFGWLAMGVGISTAFIAIGLGGIRSAVLPRWFAITTVVLGVLALLGACSIPPGGLVNYLLLPFWLIGASVIISRRQRAASTATIEVPVDVPVDA
jgi:hypothetical protein